MPPRHIGHVVGTRRCRPHRKAISGMQVSRVPTGRLFRAPHPDRTGGLEITSRRNSMATSPGTRRGTTDDRAERFERDGAMPRRSSQRLSTETKHSSKTTEFYAYVAATVGVLLAGLLTKAGDGHDDRLNAHDTWLIVGILTVGYMISRGLAKAGSRDPYWSDGHDD